MPVPGHSNIKRSPAKSSQKIGERRWLSLAVLLTGNFVTILDLFIVNVAIPSVRRELGASVAQIQLVLVGYAAVYGICLMNGARLGDLYGRRRVFMWGMGLFTLASLLCGTSQTPTSLIASRVLQGAGAALLMPQVLASVRMLFHDDERRKAFGIMGAVQGVAASISQLAGGWLIENAPADMSWRMVFLINLPIGALALLGACRVLPEWPVQMARRLDLTGAGTSALGLGMVLVPIMLGNELGWPVWSSVVPVLGVLVLGVFLYYERWLLARGDAPMFDVTLFRETCFTLGVAALFLFYSSISSFFFSLTLLLQVGLGLSPLAAGGVFTPSAVAFFAGSLVGPRMAKRLGHRVLLSGVSLFVAGLGVSAWGGAFAPTSLKLMVVGLLLNGFGQGVVIPLALNALLGQVRDDQAGAASGVVSTLQTVGTSVGVMLVGVLFFSSLSHSVAVGGVAYGHALASATFYNIAASLLSLLLFTFMFRRQRQA